MGLRLVGDAEIRDSSGTDAGFDVVGNIRI
jgi:hypothetical protein